MAAYVGYYAPQFASTTLDVAGGITNSQTTDIKLTAVPSDIDITKAGILCLTYSNPISTSVAEWVTYTSIDGTNTLQGVTRGGEGFAAKTHDNGCTVAWIVSKSHINQTADALTGVTTGVTLNTPTISGTMALTSPKITTGINDANGNELIKVTATASAVNELTLANAATAGQPTLSATGGDTNIGIDIKMKGTGKFRKPSIVGVQVIDAATDTATGDAKAFFRIPAELNGMNLTGVNASVYTAGTTNTTDIQLRNKTDSADMLSTKMTIDSTETDTSTAATPAVIDTTKDDVVTGDIIAIDIDAVHTTPAKGLYVEMRWELP
jgi:hypothetical protein